MKKVNYEKDMQIDENALDLEALEQANLMLRYTRHEADCLRDMEMAKEELEFIDADLDKKIRANPEEFEIEKVTEAVVSSTIKTHPKHIDAFREYMDARYEHNVAKGAVKACEHRKRMIEVEVDLYGKQYFAGPATPRNLSKEKEKREEKAEKSSERINRKLKRKS